MARGTTFSITVPEKLFNFYTEQAAAMGTSRSKVVVGVLMSDFMERTSGVQKINCVHMEKGRTYCSRYEMECNTDPQDPAKCESYAMRDNNG